METQLVDLIKSYLDNVGVVLTKFKSKVGQPLNGKSWKANIPDNGHYADLGITKFHRHGVGIWVYHDDKFIDFDFYDSNLPEADDSHKFLTIEPGFLNGFIESLGIKNKQWTDYTLLKQELDELTDKGILKRIESKYYLTEDIGSLNRTL